jgi:hypothetical protein
VGAGAAIAIAAACCCGSAAAAVAAASWLVSSVVPVGLVGLMGMGQKTERLLWLNACWAALQSVSSADGAGCRGLPDWKALNECAALFATPETGGKGRFLGANAMDQMRGDLAEQPGPAISAAPDHHAISD